MSLLAPLLMLLMPLLLMRLLLMPAVLTAAMSDGKSWLTRSLPAPPPTGHLGLLSRPKGLRARSLAIFVKDSTFV